MRHEYPPAAWYAPFAPHDRQSANARHHGEATTHTTRHWPRHDSPDPTVPACSAEDPHWNGHVTLQTGGTCTPSPLCPPKHSHCRNGTLPTYCATGEAHHAHWCEATTKPLPDAHPRTVPQPADSVPAWLRHHPATSIHRPCRTKQSHRSYRG